MALNDPLSNALSAISNCDTMGKKECIIKPISGFIKTVLNILRENGYIGEFKELNDGRGSYIKVNLLGNINRCGTIKPRYPVKNENIEKFEKRYLPAKGMGILIISTNSGVMVHSKVETGGKLIAYCY